MYKSILVAIDGSIYSQYACQAAIAIAQKTGAKIIGCHVYAARLHKKRFANMESGLPSKYRTREGLENLREKHQDLIGNGMKLISEAYLTDLAFKAQNKKIMLDIETPEGRNYSEILRIIKNKKPDLAILGAYGLGKINAIIGSVTERVLLGNNMCDLLVMRKPLLLSQGILVGIDGSNGSYSGMQAAGELASVFNTNLTAAAVYDPYFHANVFGAIKKILPDEYKKKFNFNNQEELHDEIIDKGLEELYDEQLEKALIISSRQGVKATKRLLTGKVYSKISGIQSGLIVMGRYGLHQEKDSPIGSNAINTVRTANTNVLIVNNRDVKIPKMETKERIEWTKEADDMTRSIPSFVRSMAVKAIERRAMQENVSKITPEFVEKIKKQLMSNMKK